MEPKSFNIRARGMIFYPIFNFNSHIMHCSLSSCFSFSKPSFSTKSSGSLKIKFKDDSRFIFKEEIDFESINQLVNDGESSKILDKELYKNSF